MTSSVDQPLYVETQRFRQWWVWALALGAATVMTVGTAGAATHNDNWIPAVLALATMALILALLYFVKLDVRVEPGYLSIRFLPFLRKRIPLSDIVSCASRTYRPILEFGGWGVRWSPFGYGWAYNVSGNHGVQLEMRSGRKLLIGSQRPEELAAAINRARGC